MMAEEGHRHLERLRQFVPTHTTYYNSFFLLRTAVILNGQPAEIGCSDSCELSLRCRSLPATGEHGDSTASVSFPCISANIEDILKNHGVFEISNFFCEESPLFQVTFSSEYGLKRFLRNKGKVEKEIAGLLSTVLQCTPVAAHIPTSVNASLLLMTPNAAAKSCEVKEVNIENHSSCMAVWKESEVFDFGDVFRVFRLHPKKLLADTGEVLLTTVLQEMQEVFEWFILGSYLGIPDHELETIKLDHINSNKECKLKMVNTWIQLGNASWCALVRALWEIGRCGLAKKIAFKFGATLPPAAFKTNGVHDYQTLNPTTKLLSSSSAQREILSSIEHNDHRLEVIVVSVEKAVEIKAEASENYLLLKSHLSAALSNVNQLLNDKMNLEKQLMSKETTIHDLKNEIRKQTELEERIKTLQHEIQQLEGQLDQKDWEINKETAEANELRTKLQEATAELVSASSELSKLKSEQETLRTELERERRELERAQYKSVFKDDTIKELKGDLSDMRKESNSHIEEIGSLKGRLTAQSEEVERLRHTLHEAEQRREQSYTATQQQSYAATVQQSYAATVQQQLHQAMQTSELKVKLAEAEEGRQEVERQLRALQREVDYEPMVKPLQFPISFAWQKCADLNIGVVGATTVVANRKVYYAHVEYTPEEDKWVVLCDAHVYGFGLAVLNNQLVLVGGRDLSTNKRTRKVTVFDNNSRKWVYPYPPMLTARSSPSAIGYQHYLVVAGGEDDDDKSLSIVEVFDRVNFKWYTAAQLPLRCHYMTPVLISDTVHLIGGFSDDKPTKAVLAIHLPSVIQTATSRSKEIDIPTFWNALPDSPLYFSAPFTAGNKLLTAGGCDYMWMCSSHIYCYDSIANKWQNVGDLPDSRCRCSCAVLPSTELLVMGGEPSWSSVYKATILGLNK